MLYRTTLSTLFLLLISLNINADSTNKINKAKTSLATFAGGCFWCMEPPFDKLSGVLKTTSGYMGGHIPNPTYKQVSSGKSGHIEVVQVTFDPTKITYAELLRTYWKNIDPTRSDGQFCDKGEQYRPAIFYHDEQQRNLAEKEKKSIEDSNIVSEEIKVEILTASRFYPAEEYHQDYYLKNPVRYRFYRYRCGRDQRLEQVWGKNPV